DGFSYDRSNVGSLAAARCCSHERTDIVEGETMKRLRRSSRATQAAALVLAFQLGGSATAQAANAKPHHAPKKDAKHAAPPAAHAAPHAGDAQPVRTARHLRRWRGNAEVRSLARAHRFPKVELRGLGDASLAGVRALARQDLRALEPYTVDALARALFVLEVEAAAEGAPFRAKIGRRSVSR